MNDEIKEILSKMERLIVYGQYNAYYDLEKQLLDYITNLKQDLANYVDVVLHDRKIIDNLQQRIDKAIDYIKWQQGNPRYDNLWRKYECDELIKILKGDDTNE